VLPKTLAKTGRAKEKGAKKEAKQDQGKIKAFPNNRIFVAE